MKSRSYCLKIYSVLSALVLFSGHAAWAVNGTWFSTNSLYANAYWTNSWNWSAQPYPAGNQTATFNNSSNTANTTIDLTGLSFGVSNIVFDTAACSTYTLGANGVNMQTLMFTNNSYLRLSSSVASNQTVNAVAQLGHDRSTSYHYFRNDAAAKLLTLAGNIVGPAAGGTAGGKTFTLLGSGPVTLSGNVGPGGATSLTLTNSTLGLVTMTGSNRFNTVVVTHGAMTLSGTNSIDTFTISTDRPITFGGTNVLQVLNLYGNATLPPVVNIPAGGYLCFTNSGGSTIMAYHDATINGPGPVVLQPGPSGNSTGDNYVVPGRTLVINAPITGPAGMEFWSPIGSMGICVLNGTNDILGNVTLGPTGTLSVAVIGNKGSTTSNLGRGTTVTLGSSGSRLRYTGLGETSDRIISLTANGIIDHSGTGPLTLTAAIAAGNANAKTLTLQGSSATPAEFSGPLTNATLGVLSVLKDGVGLWRLTTNNTHTGSTTVNAGTLSVTGPSGSLLSSASYVLFGGTLLLDNTAAANNTNRLRDASPITLSGGTLRFSNAGGAVNYSENAGAVTASAGKSTIDTVQADVGYKATLRFASLTSVSGGLVNFTGAGLGLSDRNRIFITGQADGLIGSWATVDGGKLAAYSSARGVYAADGSLYTDIAARGPSTIVSNDASNVRINTAGTSGPIELGSAVTRIASLLQNTTTPAEIDTADKALQTGGIVVPDGHAAVTVGSAPGDGTLSSVQANGAVILNNESANGLVVNAVVANNGSSSLGKAGSGSATLATANTFSGNTFVGGGSLILANSNALQNSTLTTAGTVFDSSVSDHAFMIGNLNGTFDLALSDNAGSPNPVALTVGSAGSGSHSGVISGNGSLIKTGQGALTLSGNSSYAGGFTLRQGTLNANNTNALGFGAVVNSGTLNLMTFGTDITYAGLANSLSGSGTNNVWLMTGGSTTRLLGDFSGFTGVWNIGSNAVAGASKVIMNGKDNALATINVLSNGTVYCATPIQHNAALNLGGGNTGESYGQLRLEGNAVWAGPVTLAGPITSVADGYIGASSGLGILSGAIGDNGAGFTLDKVGAGTIYLSGNNTYAGPTWIKNGTLRADVLGSVGGGASPLGSPLNAAQGLIKFGHFTTNGVLLYTGQGEISDRLVELAGTTGGATIDHSGTNLLKFSGAVTSTVAGIKKLTLQGSSAVGSGEYAGVITDGVGPLLTVVKYGTGTWTLSGDNTFSGGITNGGGTIVVTHPHALGTGGVGVYSGSTATFDLAHDGVGERLQPWRIYDTAICTIRCGRGTEGPAIDHAIESASLSGITLYVTNGLNVTSGTPTLTIGTVSLFGGSADKVSTLVPTTADLIIGQAAIYEGNFANKTLKLDGTSTGSMILGSVSNGLNTVLLRKSNASTWTLYGSNTYSGATSVDGGLLVVAGPDGRIAGTSDLTLSGNGILELRNSEQTNLTDRLRDASAIKMQGGTLRFAHTAGLTNYSEKVGAVTVSAGTNRLVTAQADVGYTSVVTLVSLTRSSHGMLDFQGAGLGADDRNRVIIGGAQPEGLIGLWATYNGTSFAAYSNDTGVIAAGDGLFTDIPARGPYAISDDAALNARISSPGTDGPLALAGATTSKLKTLLQDAADDSTIGMTNQTLQVSDIMIASGKQNLTLGTQSNEGLVMPAASGGTLALINNSANILTLNAGVTNNTAASPVVKYGSGTVKIAGRASYTGTTLINEGVLEFGGLVNSRLSGVISGAGTLAKSGTSQLHLLAANTFTGPVYINQGIVRPDQDRAFGTVDGGVFIASGATLDLGCDSSVGGTRGQDNLNMGAEQFTVSGAGADGSGAIICNALQQANAINRVALAGDTTFGGSKRWDLRSNSPRLDLNDYTLTKTGINEIAIINTQVYPGKGHMVVNQGLLRWETTSVFNGDNANTVTVNRAAIFELYQLSTNTPTWTLVLNDGAFFRGSCAANNPATNINNWAGPVTLNGLTYFYGSQGPCSWTVTSDITGSGTLVKAGNNGATLWLMGTNNTYSGGTIISNGTLFAKAVGTLPGYNSPGQVRVYGGGILALQSGDGTAEGTGGWSLPQIQDLYDNAVFTNNGTAFGVLSIDTAQASVDYPTDLTKTLGLTKMGTNSLHLGGINTFRGPLTISMGDALIDAPGKHSIGVTSISNATLTVSNTAALHVYGTNIFIGNAAADFGRMTLAGSAAWGGPLPAQNVSGPYVSVGNYGRGVLIVQDNTTMTNKIIIGQNGGSHGAIYQRDNSWVHNWCGQGNDGRIGAGGYGYYELSSGTMTNNGYFQVGVGLSSVGILAQSAGAFHMATKYGGTLGISRGGTGVVSVTGGKFNVYQSLNVGEASENAVSRGFAELTVDGSAEALVAGTVNMADRTNMFATVNLNGGRLTANLFSKAARFGSLAFLNFDGGTFRARAAGNLFATGANMLDGVYVYPGGATIDSTNLAVTLNASLSAPTGYGVADIAIIPRGGYIGPPMVTIAGGGGVGATAIADFDSDSGFVTGVTITCPGRDYTSLPTVTLAGGGTNLQTAVTGVTLAPNTSGGLIKQGSSTLTLTGTNTYGGTTTLAAGTLKLGHALAVPAATTFTFAGGTLDLGGLTLTNAVNMTGAITGGITNGTLETVFSPAGEYTVGSQTVSLNVRTSGTLRGTYLMDTGANGSCDVLAVQGNINLSNIDLNILDTDSLDRHQQYVIMTCTGTRTGTFKSDNLPDSRWRLLYQVDGSVRLVFVDGTLMRIL